jgi:hypothetical protein
MTEFKPGDRVVCTNDKPNGTEDETQLAILSRLIKGHCYTIREAYDYHDAGFALILKEIDTPFPYSWKAERFRHITPASVFARKSTPPLFGEER